MDAASMLESELSNRYEYWEGGEQLKGLARRWRALSEELFWTSSRIDEEVQKSLLASFEETYSEMLVEGPISVWTFCPHHLLPCHFTVYIGYVPTGKVLGLSKFSRLAVALGKRPVMQEQYSREVADVIWEDLKPDGVGVYVLGKHGCMLVRGVMQSKTYVSTSVLRGTFLSEPDVKGEFYSKLGLLK